MKKWLIPAGLAVIVGGLAWHFYRQVNMLTDFCFTFEGYKVLRVGLNSSTLQVNLQVKNNSDLDLNLNGYDLVIKLNGKEVSKLKSNKVQPLLANSKSLIELIFDFNPLQTLKGAANLDVLQGLVLNPSNVMVNISGTVAVSSSGVLKLNKLPVDFSMSLKDMMPTPGQESKPCL